MTRPRWLPPRLLSHIGASTLFIFALIACTALALVGLSRLPGGLP